MLHSEYTTSCFMAKSVIWHNVQGSSHKQAGQTFHYFVLTVIFSTVWMKICYFCLFQVSFIPCISDTLVGDFLSAQVIYRGKVEFCHPLNNFCGHESKLFFVDSANHDNYSAKNKIHVFETKPWKYGNAKISHYMVFVLNICCLRIFIYCYIFRIACLFWNKQATNILKTVKILLLMVQFHNGTLKFCKLGLGGDRLGYQSPQLFQNNWKIGPIMMPEKIGYTISKIFFIRTCMRQDDQNWYSWSHEMCFKNLFLELVACDIPHADKYWIWPKMLALR